MIFVSFTFLIVTSNCAVMSYLCVINYICVLFSSISQQLNDFVCPIGVWTSPCSWLLGKYSCLKLSQHWSIQSATWMETWVTSSPHTLLCPAWWFILLHDQTQKIHFNKDHCHKKKKHKVGLKEKDQKGVEYVFNKKPCADAFLQCVCEMVFWKQLWNQRHDLGQIC